MKHKHIFYLLSGLFFAGVILFAGTQVLADDYGLGATAGAAGLNKGDVPTIIGNVIGTGLSLISVLFFLLMIYGGILWMTARGKDEQASKALDTIIAAIIGIVIILAAYAITNFVFKSVGGGGATAGGTSAGSTSKMFKVYGTTSEHGCDDGTCDGVLCVHSPDTTSPCAVNIPEDTCVESLSESDGQWQKVKYSGTEGWAHSNYLNTSPTDCGETAPATCTAPAACSGASASGGTKAEDYCICIEDGGTSTDCEEA